MVNSQTVDLNPLFRWWTKHDGDRPLRAWPHISGTVIGTNVLGWTVNAQVEDPEQAGKGETVKIILKNPPLQDLARFETLKARRKTLEEERARLLGQSAEADSHLKEIATEQKTPGRTRLRTQALTQQTKQWKQTKDAARAQLKPIDAEVADIDKQLAAFRDRDKYSVDGFALERGEKIGGVPVYDYGVPLH